MIIEKRHINHIFWVKLSLFNLLIVALVGVILRYKIAFSLPFIQQKYLLHGHSHFAFSGWVTQLLMVLMIHFISYQPAINSTKKYHSILWGNAIGAYGMLLSFPVQGYGWLSISFSTISTFSLYVFGLIYWKDLNKIDGYITAKRWFKAAIIANVLSSFGAFMLGFLMANKIVHQNWYLASIYFFLHFQYNGWFFMAGMGLLFQKFWPEHIYIQKQAIIFWLFAIACVPAYFLSTLWMRLPLFIYYLVVIAAIAQLVGWIVFLEFIYQYHLKNQHKSFELAHWLFVFGGIAFTIKLLLQTFSTIPLLSTWAFGFRPIVIAYLHLVLLGVISFSLIGYLLHNHFLILNKTTLNGIKLFVIGFVMNESVLLLQGIGAIYYKVLQFANEGLLVAAFTLFIGILITFIGNIQNKIIVYE